MSTAPTFFETPADFRRWLQKHHRTAAELWVGLYKKGSGQASITWPEAVDEALCFGWIDGVRKSIDGRSYMNRFTPRRRGSHWSSINIRRVQELIRARRMKPAGLTAFEARDPAKIARASFEQADVRFDPALEAQFKAHTRAWTFFAAQPPGYRKVATWWVMSAKREPTRARRLEILVRQSAAGERLDPMRPAGGAAAHGDPPR